jgi:hypothetical protein
MSGGKPSLKMYRQFIQSRVDIREIRHFQQSKPFFKLFTHIDGGIQFFLKDAKYKGLCKLNGRMISLNRYDIIVSNGSSFSLIDKVLKYRSITSIYSSINFILETNDKRLSLKKLPGYVRCLTSKHNNTEMFVDAKHVDHHPDFNKFKVVTSRAYSATLPLGKIHIIGPSHTFTSSFIGFVCNSENEAKSLASYLNTWFVRYMVAARKLTRHLRQDVFDWVPLPRLSSTWNDVHIQSWLHLTQKDMQQITHSAII